MSDLFHKSQAAIDARTARVAVIGLDAVGLQRAYSVALCGFQVLGFDPDSKRLDDLASSLVGESPCSTRPLKELGLHGFRTTDEPAALAGADVLLVNVPTLLNAARSPDLLPASRAAEAIASQLCPGQLILLERTAYPGMTREVIQPLLDKRGLKVGVDYFLGVAPHRISAPPRLQNSDQSQVVGGIDSTSLQLGLAFYRALGANVLPSSSVEAAEASALVEGVFQLVRAGVEHELKVLFERMQIDASEVLDLARSDPSQTRNRNSLQSQSGESVRCAPLLLGWVAPRFGLTVRSIELAGELYRSVPAYLLDRITDALNGDSKPLRGSKLLFWGEPDSQENDHSLMGQLLQSLRSKGAIVRCHDLHGSMTIRDEYASSIAPDDGVSIHTADAMVILADRPDTDWEQLVRVSRIVIDICEATVQVTTNRERIIRI